MKFAGSMRDALQQKGMGLSKRNENTINGGERMGNYVIIGIVVVIVFFAVRSVIKRGKNGCCGGGACSVQEVKAEDRNPEHYSYKAMVTVEDMHCENCKKKVESALNAVKGVWGTVDLKSKTAEVRMKEEHSEMEIREWINKAGYGVSHVELI